MKVIAQFDLGTAMLQRLQAAVADQAPRVTRLDSPEAPAQRPLMRYLLIDLPRHVLSRMSAYPPHDKRVQIHRRERIDIFGPKRAKS